MNSDKLYELSIKIESVLGLNFPKSRHRDMLRGIKEAAKEILSDDSHDSIIKWILDGELKQADLNSLASHLTIGETYFFREEPAIEHFKQVIIPQIREKISKEKYKIWSAGCSSGEEPYSFAILLREYLSPEDCGKISITATDISPKALQKAISGEYGEWSFRETDHHIKRKYFTKKGTSWIINSEVRNMVNFQYLNLASSNFPSSANNTSDIDLLLCRNVLMYFTPDRIKEVSKKFYEALNENGWFITSQVELNDDYFGNFNRLHSYSGIFYQKSISSPSIYNAPNEISTISSDTKPVKIRDSKPRKKVNKTPLKNRLAIKPQPPKHEVSNAEISFEKALEYADKGDIEKSTKIIFSLIDQGIANSDIFYLLASIFFDSGDILKAKEYATKALYLNPKDINSNILLGNIFKKENNLVQSQKYFENANRFIEESDS